MQVGPRGGEEGAGGGERRLCGCGHVGVGSVVLRSAKMKRTSKKKESLLWRLDESGVPINL